MYFFSMFPFDVVTSDNLKNLWWNGYLWKEWIHLPIKIINSKGWVILKHSVRRVNAIKSIRFYLCSYIIDGNMISSIFECDIQHMLQYLERIFINCCYNDNRMYKLDPWKQFKLHSFIISNMNCPVYTFV
jgi:hypothetical protein